MSSPSKNKKDGLSEISVDQALRGGRKTAYFGDIPYKYGKTSHPANPYPDCDIFRNIFRKMKSVDPNFTPENYTCLVNMYDNGRVTIPRHSDDEQQIIPGSKIYTISVGATRVMRFINNTGRIRETDQSLVHGSVFSMDADSQLDWSHSLLANSQETNPRISFTFRRLRQVTPQAPTVHIPPIKRPDPINAGGSHRRVLFLSDSVLKNTPESIFNRIGGDNKYRCIKKVNYELVNVFNFEREFRYTDIVVISCGVNDLSRYSRRPDDLADLVINRLKDCCARNCNTTFVFTSILSTAHGWLNGAIGAFNRHMFELSTKVPNLTFFDSHHVLVNSPITSVRSRTSVIVPGGDGVHITFDARKLVTDELINGLSAIARGVDGKLSNDVGLCRWRWPLRPAYRCMLTPNRIQRGVPWG